jgi:uncharacterized membrane protein required for colicin V production
MTFAKIFDIGTALALAFFVARGARRGLTGEITSLLGLVASAVCAWKFSRPAADMVLRHFPNWDRAVMEMIYGRGADYYSGGGLDRTILELVCSVVLFMGVSLAFSAAGKALRALLKAAHLSFFDHLLGALSGGARVFCVELFIYGAVTLFSSAIPSAWLNESAAMKFSAAAWPPVFKFLTEKGWLRTDRLTPGNLLDSLPLDSLPLDSLNLNALPSNLNALPLDSLPSNSPLNSLPSLGVPAPEGAAPK